MKKLGALKPHLKKKYLIILILTAVISIMLPSYIPEGNFLYGGYGILSMIGLLNLGLFMDLHWSQIVKVLRPYRVARISQFLSIVNAFYIIGSTLYLTTEFSEELVVPFIVMLLFILTLIVQHFAIFLLAERAKKEKPGICEFC